MIQFVAIAALLGAATDKPAPAPTIPPDMQATFFKAAFEIQSAQNALSTAQGEYNRALADMQAFCVEKLGAGSTVKMNEQQRRPGCVPGSAADKKEKK